MRFIPEYIPSITSGRMYTPYFRAHTPYHKWWNVYPLSQVVKCIPPITSGGMYTPYHKWWNVYPLSQVVECIPPITSGGMYTPYHKWWNVYPLSQVVECIPPTYTPYHVYSLFQNTYPPGASEPVPQVPRLRDQC